MFGEKVACFIISITDNIVQFFIYQIITLDVTLKVFIVNIVCMFSQRYTFPQPLDVFSQYSVEVPVGVKRPVLLLTIRFYYQLDHMVKNS